MNRFFRGNFNFIHIISDYVFYEDYEGKQHTTTIFQQVKIKILIQLLKRLKQNTNKRTYSIAYIQTVPYVLF